MRTVPGTPQRGLKSRAPGNQPAQRTLFLSPPRGLQSGPEPALKEAGWFRHSEGPAEIGPEIKRATERRVPAPAI